MMRDATGAQGDAERQGSARLSRYDRLALALGVLMLFLLAGGVWLANGQRLFEHVMTGVVALCF